MSGLGSLDTLFVVTASLFHLALIVHFALRKWRFGLAMRYGWLIYALSIPAMIVSDVLVLGGKSWSLWLGGYLFPIWAICGYYVDYVRKIAWRTPIRWSIAGPYLFLYLATVMFYWWPVGFLYRPLWYVFAALFVISTALNLTSHRAHDASSSSAAI